MAPSIEYLPAGHCCGVPVPVEEQEYPAGQFSQEVAPSVEYFPAGHGLHVVELEAFGEYVPAGHAETIVTVPRSGWNWLTYAITYFTP